MSQPLRLLLAAAALALLVPATAAASAPSPERSERALERVEELLGPGGGASSSPAARREATALLRDLAVGLPLLDPAERRRARAILARPDKPGDHSGGGFGAEAPASPVCNPELCVHWGTAPRHAPQRADGDGDGVPDYVESVLDAAARSYAVENGNLGWRDARSDGSRGARRGVGDHGQVDIYLLDLGTRLFGYATPDTGQSGRSRSGYLVLDNDYSGFRGRPLDLMRVTLAHEYNHILQFGYDSFQDGWMFESTATWVEEIVYPDSDDYLNFVRDFAKAPQKPMAERDREAFRLYGAAMWNHWLSARLGAETIRSAWELSTRVRPSGFAVAAYDRAISDHGGRSFSHELAAFAAISAEWNSDASFPDAGDYPEIRRSGTLRGRRRITLDHTAYRLYRVRAAGSKRLTVHAERGTRSALALVGRLPDGSTTVALRYLPRGGRGSVKLADAGRLQRLTAVVVNADGRVRGAGRRYSRDGRAFRLRVR